MLFGVILSPQDDQHVCVAGARDMASSMIESNEKTRHLDFDANAYYLTFLLRDIEGTPRNEEMGPKSNLVLEGWLEQAFACCFRMLRMDPKSVPTLRVVVSLYDTFNEVVTDFREDVLHSLAFSVTVVLPTPVQDTDVSPDRMVQIRALVIIEKILYDFLVHDSEESTGAGSNGTSNPWVNALTLISGQQYWHPTMFQMPFTEEGYAHLTVLCIVWQWLRDKKLLWTCLYDPSELDTILHGILPAGGRKAPLPSPAARWIEDRLQVYLRELQRF